MERRLTTIMATNVVDYSAQMGSTDESADRILTIDPEFSVSNFLLTEFYESWKTRDELENTLL